jgi:hypothetical protein
MKKAEIIEARKDGVTIAEIERVFDLPKTVVWEVLNAHKSEDDLQTLGKRVNEEHQLAFGSAQTAFQHALHCGELLLQVKAKLKHGKFLPWLRENFAGSQRHAYRYMKLSANLSRVTNLPSGSIRGALEDIKSAKGNGQHRTDFLTLRMFVGTCRVNDPLKSWHVVDDANIDDQQSIVCQKCWSHITGGTSLGSSDDWFYACRCEGSHRNAVLKRKKH